MDLLNTYYMMNMLSGLNSTSSVSNLLSGNTSSLGSADTLSFLSILQSLQNLQNTERSGNTSNVNNASILGATTNSVTNTSSASNLSAGSTMDALFEKAAERYQVDVDLLKAIGKAESNFNEKAVSAAGAIGVMQLMPSTARSLGVTNPYDAEQNIMGGAKYISQMLDRYDGDVELALAAYNAGPGNVDKYDGIPPFKETQNYVARVLDYMGDDLSTGKTVTASQDESSASAAASVNASGSGTIEIKTDTLITMMELMRAQMQLQMLNSAFAWNSTDSSSLFSSGTDSLGLNSSLGLGTSSLGLGSLNSSLSTNSFYSV